MKAFATLAAAAVLITSPISASAQTSSAYEDCMNNCYAQFSAARQACYDFYGNGGWWIIDRDLCEYQASQDADACTSNCASQFPQSSAYNPSIQRFRPVIIATPAKAII